MELNGKVALVTGASAGIGRAYALALAGAGATVVAAARTLGEPGASEPQPNSLVEVVRAAEGLPGRVHAQICDMAIEADIARTIGQTIANHGRIDILVNNAALLTQFEPLTVSCEDWDQMLRVNLRGPYLAIRHAAPQMKRQRAGSIINITARGALSLPAASFMPNDERPFDGTLVYAVAKAGLNRMSFFMSEELRPWGIAVNALSPGFVATATALAKNPRLKELGGKDATPEVLGPALLHLAVQTAETLTGQVLHTDEFGKSWGV
jgi:NAD(P)-dependent dehydrogenase (short-subunit alcohol dehydrogenase family)